MFKNLIWVVPLVTILTACGGDPTSMSAAGDRDASSNAETAVVNNDRPPPPPDAPVNPVDAGPAIQPDVQTAQDAQIVADASPEDAGTTPAPDAMMVVMRMPFVSQTCNRVNELCWGVHGEACQRIFCQMDGSEALMTVPSNLSAGMGPEAVCYSTVTGGICEGQNTNGTRTGGRWEGLNPTMNQFTSIRPGYADRTIEGRSR